MEQQRGKRSFIDEHQMMAAITKLSEKTMTLHEASMYYGISKTTLFTRFKRVKKEMVPKRELTLQMGLKNREQNNKFATKQVLTVSQEKMLVEYLLTCARMNYGLTLSSTQELAYQFASREGRTMPESWTRDQKAGKKWARCFLKRHKEISLRKPENTSLARNMSFNKESVTLYFNNLKSLMDVYGFEPENIYNMDETGLSTVLRPPKVIAGKNIKQVGLCVSCERGESVTIVGIANAAGEWIPPVIIFPRKRSHPDYMEGSVEGAIPLFNEKGYMDTPSFLKTLEHFKMHTSVSKENPILLILDNHSSHLSLEAIRFCREHGIHMLTLPPHTSHKTQPLDLSVFGPFKSHCVTAFDEWTKAKEGNRITVQNIARISAKAFEKSFSSSNIKSGFRAGGIFPLDNQKLFQFFQDKEPESHVISSLGPHAVSSDEQMTNEMDWRTISQMSINISGTSNKTEFDSVDDAFEAPMGTKSEHHIIADLPSCADDTRTENYMNFTFSCDDKNHAVTNITNIPTSSKDSPGNPSIHHIESNSSSSLFSPVEDLSACVNPLHPQEEQRSMSPAEVLNLSLSSPLDDLLDHEMHSRKIYLSTVNTPLDLSMKSSSTFSSSSSQLRFGGLEIIRPIQNPHLRHSSKRSMVSTVVTGSPELKRREEMEEKKRVKEENKRIRDLKKSIREGIKKNPIPKTEMMPKKRGRPRKLPLIEKQKI